MANRIGSVTSGAARQSMAQIQALQARQARESGQTEGPQRGGKSLDTTGSIAASQFVTSGRTKSFDLGTSSPRATSNAVMAQSLNRVQTLNSYPNRRELNMSAIQYVQSLPIEMR